MADSKLLVASIAVALVVLGARADAGIAEEASASDSPSSLELVRLRSKVSSLESSILEKTHELKSKEQSIARLENVIQEKLESLASLQSEMESIQKKGLVDAHELAGKADARSVELERQVEKLMTDIEAQTRKRDALEVQASEAEKKMQEMNLKLESLQKTISEQKRRIQKTEHALHVAEEELMRAQLEATSKSSELKEIHGAWLPPWLATHINYCQDSALSGWNEHVKPALEALVQKASEKSVRAHKWVQPHLETAKTKWIPSVKEQVVTFKTSTEPYVQEMTTITIEAYKASKTAVTWYVIKIQESVVPFLQEAQKFSKPYINEVVTVSKPHVEKVRVALKPYTKRAFRLYRKLRKSSTNYHLQVQATIQEKLKKHEATKPLATKEFTWLMASGLMAFPVFFLFRGFSAIFCKKARRPRQNAHGSHTHRRSTRRQAEK